MDFKKIFQNLITSGNLSHAYLFFGNPDSQFIACLSNYLENNLWQIPAKPLIDLSIISPDEKNNIGLETIKQAANFLWQRPLKSKRKIIVVEKADALTSQAQNAILKIAEEPPSQAIIFLSVKDPDLLLPALISRFQKVYLPPLLSESNLDLDQAKNFLQASWQKKSEIIKEVIADDRRLAVFIESLMRELDKDPQKNFASLKELSYRWSLISRYNVNKRLQLEVFLEQLQANS